MATPQKDQPPDKRQEGVLGRMFSERTGIIDRLAGPIQFLGLVIMVCECSLAMSTAFVGDTAIQWFLSISMVAVLCGSVFGFFYLIVFHHEKLYPPPLYPENIVKDVFVRRFPHANRYPSSQELREFIVQFLLKMNRPYPLADITDVVAMHYECPESVVRTELSQMSQGRVLAFENNHGVTFVTVPVSTGTGKPDSMESTKKP